MEKLIFLVFLHKTFKYHYKVPLKISNSNSNFQNIGLNDLNSNFSVTDMFLIISIKTWVFELK